MLFKRTLILGYGEGTFNMSSDPRTYNLINPIMKNTTPIHPYGWTALRFRSDNPGAWAFHCHISLISIWVWELFLKKGWRGWESCLHLSWVAVKPRGLGGRP
ncbi:L-ascorbate oxidase [Vitis vinifera]|uniref:L-ascorbate oxidase n=1 Tax=Vitis vinifera TaxID=29760 RepID=A0A438F5R4_VITVI|nr:L-ascorbate oxidase [Vitis vinifera]